MVELNDGLDFEAGGDIALNYARIYDYCQRRLIEANVRQADAILEEVVGALDHDMFDLDALHKGTRTAAALYERLSQL